MESRIPNPNLPRLVLREFGKEELELINELGLSRDQASWLQADLKAAIGFLGSRPLLTVDAPVLRRVSSAVVATESFLGDMAQEGIVDWSDARMMAQVVDKRDIPESR